VVEVGERRVEPGAHFFALERAGCRIDGELRHSFSEVGSSFSSFEVLRFLDEVLHLVDDKRHIAAERLGREAELDKLKALAEWSRKGLPAYLLLLHQLGIRAIVHH
jgi:hypothetical protein